MVINYGASFDSSIGRSVSETTFSGILLDRLFTRQREEQTHNAPQTHHEQEGTGSRDGPSAAEDETKRKVGEEPSILGAAEDEKKRKAGEEQSSSGAEPDQKRLKAEEPTCVFKHAHGNLTKVEGQWGIQAVAATNKKIAKHTVLGTIGEGKVKKGAAGFKYELSHNSLVLDKLSNEVVPLDKYIGKCAPKVKDIYGLEKFKVPGALPKGVQSPIAELSFVASEESLHGAICELQKCRDVSIILAMRCREMRRTARWCRSHHERPVDHPFGKFMPLK